MDISITEAVVCEEAPDAIWQKLLEPGAVTGFLGIADDVGPYRPEQDGDGGAAAEPDANPRAESDGEFLGHTFTIVGLGGGVYHAAFDEIDEPNTLAYALWRDDTPEAVAILTYTLHAEDGRTVLTANFTMDMPMDALFGAYGSVLMPVIEPMARGYMAHRLRSHLRTLA